MKKTYLCLALVLAIASVHLSICAVAEDKDKGKTKKEPGVTTLAKQVQGEVSNIGKRFISVVYERDVAAGTESEMMFPIDAKTIRLEHKRSLAEIAQGDTVLVIYKEETIDDGNRQKTRHIADTIRFLKPADASSVYKPKAAATEDARDIEGLSLKGVK